MCSSSILSTTWVDDLVAHTFGTTCGIENDSILVAPHTCQGWFWGDSTFTTKEERTTTSWHRRGYDASVGLQSVGFSFDAAGKSTLPHRPMGQIQSLDVVITYRRRTRAMVELAAIVCRFLLDDRLPFPLVLQKFKKLENDWKTEHWRIPEIMSLVQHVHQQVFQTVRFTKSRYFLQTKLTCHQLLEHLHAYQGVRSTFCWRRVLAVPEVTAVQCLHGF